ncbi:uncharacterized protein (TIGR02448 family) [Pseudomonas nitritireducens]|uniref:Uncharacterized protein (TIGR02448 family) n=1 Tax=Pseudomonas nitroreducens TaxID=46680 RepID=A0A7W7KRK7_PSENT|nr:DUF2388 domain-containing protein [Pseudomonas nitritireducens]MBB4867657.1 uncharacterized protein (TIGR02448 family) [Pseudomonas nitritireducens]
MLLPKYCAITLALMLASTSAAAFIKVIPDFKDEPIMATTFWSAMTTTGPFISTTLFSQKMSGDLQDKLRAAQDDAAAFIASDGAIYGVYLESALHALHQEDTWASHTNPELVQAILAWSGGATRTPSD